MTLENLKTEKQKLEEKISEQLNDFSKKYQIIIKDIDMASNILRNTAEAVQSEIYVNIKIEL